MRKILSWALYNESNTPQILPVENADIVTILDMCVEVLSNVDNPERIKGYLGRATDWNLSKKCVLNGEIIGAYLLNEFPLQIMLDNCKRSIPVGEYDFKDYEKYRTLRGLHGLALVVLPEFQKIGAGRKLRDVPLHMDYDYIWGMQLKSLQNIEQWTNFGRKLIGEFLDEEKETVYITLMDLDKKSA